MKKKTHKKKITKFLVKKKSDRLLNPASNPSEGPEVIALPHLKSTVGVGVLVEVAVCVCVCVCLCFCRSVLILYPYLQICPCCLSDPRLPSHLISPSFCSPNTPWLRSRYVSVCVFCGLLWQKNIAQSNQC